MCACFICVCACVCFKVLACKTAFIRREMNNSTMSIMMLDKVLINLLKHQKIIPKDIVMEDKQDKFSFGKGINKAAAYL